MTRTEILLRRVMLVALVLGHVVWSALVLTSVSGEASLLAATLPFCQFGLLATILFLGPGSLRARCALAILGMATIVALCGKGWSFSSGMEWRILGAEAVLVLVCSGAMRLAGARIVRLSDPDRGRPMLQCSIRGLFVLTIAAALLVSSARWIRTLTSENAIVSDKVITPLLGAAFSLVILFGVIWLLRRGPVYLRGLFYATAVSGLGATLPWLVWRPADAVSMLTWLGLQGAVVGGTLLALRAAGYRLVRNPGLASSQRPIGSTRRSETAVGKAEFPVGKAEFPVGAAESPIGKALSELPCEKPGSQRPLMPTAPTVILPNSAHTDPRWKGANV